MVDNYQTLEKKEANLNNDMEKNLFLEMFDIFVNKITKEILEDHANGFLDLNKLISLLNYF